MAPGDYPVDTTLVVDRSLELRGSSVSVKDADGWPTGEVAAGTETRVYSTNSALLQLLLVGRGDGGALSNVSIRGFVFEGTPTGISMLLTRVQDYRVATTFPRTSEARHAISGLFGPRHGQPLQRRGAGRRHLHRWLSGITIERRRHREPLSAQRPRRHVVERRQHRIPELGDQLDAAVRDNDLSGKRLAPQQGSDCGLFILRRGPGCTRGRPSAASIKAVVKDNRLVGNRIGVFDRRWVSLPTRGHRVRQSRVLGRHRPGACRQLADGKLAHTGSGDVHSTASGAEHLDVASWQYLHGATFTISDRDGTLAEAWIDHPASDPVLGAVSQETPRTSRGECPRVQRRRIAERQEFLARSAIPAPGVQLTEGPLRAGLLCSARPFNPSSRELALLDPQGLKAETWCARGTPPTLHADLLEDWNQLGCEAVDRLLRLPRDVREQALLLASQTATPCGSCRPCACARSPRTAPALLHCTLLFLQTAPYRAFAETVWRTRARRPLSVGKGLGVLARASN